MTKVLGLFIGKYYVYDIINLMKELIGRKIDKRLFVAMAMIFLIFVAFICHVMSTKGIHSLFFGLVGSCIYLLLILIWMISVKERVIQKNIQTYLIFICVLMFLWISLRSYKYMFSNDPRLDRILWYCYYFPMIFIPLLTLYMTISLGKGESYRLESSYDLLLIPAIFLLILVLTNDQHHYVFNFPNYGDASNDIYVRCWGYYLILVWIFSLLSVVFVLLVKKCRVTYSKQMIILPMIPLVLCVIYCALYWFDLKWFQLYFGDMTIVFCVLIMLIGEACIQSRLIPSNIGYGEFFQANSLKTMICDDDLKIEVKSDNAPELSIQDLRSSIENELYFIDDNTLLKSHRIRNGFVFWQEDVTEIVKELEQLKQTQAELEDMGDLIAEENRQKSLLAKIEEEKRLYELIEKETKDQVSRLNHYIELLKETDDLGKAKKILGNIVFIGTYIKRKSNLLFIRAQKENVEALELQLCFNESLANLELSNVQCRSNFFLDGSLPADIIFKLYDIFEDSVEACIDTINSILVYVGSKEGCIEMNMSISCEDDLLVLKEKYSELLIDKDDDDLYYLSVKEHSYEKD